MIRTEYIVDASSLPRDYYGLNLWEKLATFYEAGNDSYHRWYPHPSWDYIDGDVKAAVNTWLREKAGMTAEMEARRGEYSYILFHFSW